MKDIPGRYLLRLGQGELDLETDVDFSRVGRVNAMLNRRLELLAEIERLAISLGVSEDMAYTCRQLRTFGCSTSYRVGKSLRHRRQMQGSNLVRDWFPFKAYFSDMPQPLFKGIHKRHGQSFRIYAIYPRHV